MLSGFEHACDDLTVQWFALRVRTGAEKIIAACIRGKGFEEFLPIYQCRRRWSDRMKNFELPLFPGYLFCRLNPVRRFPLLTIPGVMHFVGVGKVPAPINDDEISAIQAAVQSGLLIEPHHFLELGQRVRLEDGPLAGLEGVLVKVRGQHRIVVSITLLKRSVSVEIDREWVAPVLRKPAVRIEREILAQRSW